MPRITSTLLLMLVNGAVHADVLDHHHGVVAQLFHQTFGAHHAPFTLLLIVAGAVAFRSWFAARK